MAGLSLPLSRSFNQIGLQQFNHFLFVFMFLLKRGIAIFHNYYNQSSLLDQKTGILSKTFGCAKNFYANKDFFFTKKKKKKEEDIE